MHPLYTNPQYVPHLTLLALLAKEHDVTAGKQNFRKMALVTILPDH